MTFIEALEWLRLCGDVNDPHERHRTPPCNQTVLAMAEEIERLRSSRSLSMRFDKALALLREASEPTEENRSAVELQAMAGMAEEIKELRREMNILRPRTATCQPPKVGVEGQIVALTAEVERLRGEVAALRASNPGWRIVEGKWTCDVPSAVFGFAPEGETFAYGLADCCDGPSPQLSTVDSSPSEGDRMMEFFKGE